jgi:hypothetical protein
MTQTKSHKSPKGVVKDSRALNIMKHLDPKSASSSSRRSNKSLPLSSFTTDHRRRASSSSISSVSSVSSIEALSDDANESEEDADDEKEQPAVRGPSYGRRDKGHKSGIKSTGRKRVRLSDDDGYDGQRSSDESDSYESSDDVYAAVDDISDGDDEDQDVEILEELLIVESEDEHEVDDVFKTSNVSELELAGTNTFEDHLLLSAASFFDEEQLYSAMETFGETDFASEAAAETPMPRRVHFEEDSDTSSDSDSHTEDEIPSDFLQQDSLDPQLRRMIENDNENYSGRRRQSDELFAESDYGHSNIYHVESDAVSEGSESSGYESMQRTWTCTLILLLTNLKPTMARPQMKTSRRPQQSPIPVPFSVAIPRPLCLPPTRPKANLLLAGAVQSWVLLLQTPTNRWPWSTVQGSIL